jgi:hypothetical protein
MVGPSGVGSTSSGGRDTMIDGDGVIHVTLLRCRRPMDVSIGTMWVFLASMGLFVCDRERK